MIPDCVEDKHGIGKIQSVETMGMSLNHQVGGIFSRLREYSRLLYACDSRCGRHGPVRQRCLGVMLSVLLAAGCATAPVIQEEPAEESPAVEVPEVAKKEPIQPKIYPVAPFDKETLYELLVAEVAGYQNQFDIALQHYGDLAVATRDAGVAARATRLAAYLKRDDVAVKTAQIWAEVDPDNIDAHRHAADQLVRAGQLEKAVAHMEAVKELGGLANFDLVAFRAASLDQQTKESLLKTISQMLLRFPEDEQLLFSLAVLLDQTGKPEDALTVTDQLLTGKRDINVIILRVNVLKKLQRAEEAIEFLRAEVDVQPDHKRLREFFARLLSEEADLDQAKEQYEELLARSPQDGDMLFALALIAMEQEQDDVASDHLRNMVRWNRRAGEAHFFLGSIAEKSEDSTLAIKEYRQVGPRYFAAAQGRIAELMLQQDDLPTARTYLETARAESPDMRTDLVLVEAQLLTEHADLPSVIDFLSPFLAETPDDPDLLYYRAMTGQKAGDLGLLESDLRRIIELDPENADALNALGYTLTDQTERHDEALDLITRALELKPNEPAFIDSMGWVLYRLMNYEKALTYLRQALTLFPNDEVAAHLGEVLWVVGDKAEANKVWQEGLELKPDSKILKDVIERLQP
jgi:tetratricopeptide (TPR) repeat protein